MTCATRLATVVLVGSNQEINSSICMELTGLCKRWENWLLRPACLLKLSLKFRRCSNMSLVGIASQLCKLQHKAISLVWGKKKFWVGWVECYLLKRNKTIEECHYTKIANSGSCPLTGLSHLLFNNTQEVCIFKRFKSVYNQGSSQPAYFNIWL